MLQIPFKPCDCHGYPFFYLKEIKLKEIYNQFYIIVFKVFSRYIISKEIEKNLNIKILLLYIFIYSLSFLSEDFVYKMYIYSILFLHIILQNEVIHMLYEYILHFYKIFLVDY